MRTTHSLKNSEINDALADWAISQGLAQAGDDISVRLTHDINTGPGSQFDPGDGYRVDISVERAKADD